MRISFVEAYHNLIDRINDTYHDTLVKDLFDSVTPSTILLYVRAIGLFFKM